MAAPQALRLLAIAYKVRRQFAETFSHVSPTASPHVPHVAPTPTYSFPFHCRGSAGHGLQRMATLPLRRHAPSPQSCFTCS